MNPARVGGPPDLVPVLAASHVVSDHMALRAILNGGNWQLHSVFSCLAAVEFLRENEAPVVICEASLPHGGWRTLLESVIALPAPPRLIVCSRLADEHLRSEVLNLGGWEVLATPFVSEEVLKVLVTALSSGDGASRELSLE